MSKPIYVDWCAKDALDGMTQLSDIEELAYRRIIDMIYASDDHLLDDDESLRWSTKTGSKWPKIKKRLLDLGKIEIVDNRISNAHCRKKLSEARHRIKAASNAGRASSEKRKALENNNTTPTDVGTPVDTPVGTRSASRNLRFTR